MSRVHCSRLRVVLTCKGRKRVKVAAYHWLYARLGMVRLDNVDCWASLCAVPVLPALAAFGIHID